MYIASKAKPLPAFAEGRIEDRDAGVALQGKTAGIRRLDSYGNGPKRHNQNGLIMVRLRISWICKILGHRRIKSRVRLFAGKWVSDCAWCDAQLIRFAPGDWRRRDTAYWTSDGWMILRSNRTPKDKDPVSTIHRDPNAP